MKSILVMSLLILGYTSVYSQVKPKPSELSKLEAEADELSRLSDSCNFVIDTYYEIIDLVQKKVALAKTEKDKTKRDLRVNALTNLLLSITDNIERDKSEFDLEKKIDNLQKRIEKLLGPQK